ncbi:non-ribosomal peptide synthetase [Desmospora profundinema]|uniref:Amino acid adenylation domain-containing protein/non-ribosomal peptide synthase protein (TIGR01720 family) n=1 Tax=Desmospora profundinema TaxID=1571184 RepID=A0ABU1IQR3_9BACL|nr:non-ribosomal peptide synthetase [Desmospora profundinema]MDR6226882.1 amino acid adenylation domain-containing protein/non-ribosomal peptide synthase protein (TIGR01720 family) [Desmospora profundinema]
MMNKNNIQDLYELSPLQKGILYHHLKEPDSRSYFEQTTFYLQGVVDPDVLEESLNELVERYEILRTNFIHKNFSQPMQVVWKKRPVPLERFDWSDAGPDARSAWLQEYRRKDREKGFDLEKEPLIRFAWIRLSGDEYALVWSHHHILLDGWCLGLLVPEWLEAYQERLCGRVGAAEKGVPYSRYIRWLLQQDVEEAKRFWRKRLDGWEGGSGLPATCFQPKAAGMHEKVKFRLSGERTRQLEALARSHGATASTAFQTLWGVLLQKYQDTRDILFGSVVSGRPADLPDVEKMVGLFINTIPVRVKTGEGESFLDVLQRVRDDALESTSHDYVSLADIQPAAAAGREWIDHVVVFENYPVSPEEWGAGNDTGFRITSLEAFEQTHYDFDVTVYPGEEWEVVLSFDPGVHAADFIKNIPNHFHVLVDAVLKTPDFPLQSIEVVEGKERKRLLSDWNRTKTDDPRNQTIHGWLEERVRKHPQRLAVVMGEERIDYGEWNKRANRLARKLREEGVKREEFVGVLCDRSPKMVVAILAVLKAGGAYVPLDPDTPVERMQTLLQDSGVRVLVVGEGLGEDLSFSGVRVPVDQPEGCGEDLESVNGPGDLAYMIYTSGSTGKPKGVMIEHRSVCGLASTAPLYAIRPESRVSQCASFSFDASVSELFCTLFHGATLYMVERETLLSGHAFIRWLRDNRITTIPFIPPTLLRELPEGDLPDLELISTGGEELSADLVRIWGRDRMFINAYGPTETTVDATLGVCSPDGKKPSIGRPVANKSVYVLDSNHHLMPIGVPGELCIGGDGLARGYWNRPEWTEKRFVDNPFVPGERMYKTGDRVRFLPDGNLEYLGRMDHQVKIRGHRIELGEIEARLTAHPHVKDGVVTVIRDGDEPASLCAYIVTESVWSVDDLREYLAGELPEYMIPSYFIELDTIPLTTGGKVDRQSLPAPRGEWDRRRSSHPPANRTEEELAAIWREVLGSDGFGMEDDFFHLGGHSLSAMKLVSRIHQHWQVEIPLREIFGRRTLRKMADWIRMTQKSDFRPIQPVEGQADYPVSSAQKRMMVVQQMEGADMAYHIPTVLEMEGELDVKRLNGALAELVKRHDSFRTSFHFREGELKQRIHPEVPFALACVEVTEAEAEEQARRFIQPFSLDSAPLFRARLLRLAPDRHWLLLDMHHIIADGVSMEIVTKELASLYEGKSLPALRIQYKDFAVWQQQMRSSRWWEKQERFWLERFSDGPKPLPFPTDHPRPPVRTHEGRVHTFRLDPRLADRLTDLSLDRKTTRFLVMLAAYKILLSRYAGQEEVTVGTPVAGRSHADLESTVGMFVNLLPLKSHLAEEESFSEYLKQCTAVLLESVEHGDFPFEDLVEKLNLPRDTSRHPLFDTLFVWDSLPVKWRLSGLTVRPRDPEWGTAKFDMTWYIQDGEQPRVLVEYNTHLFKEETVERMGRHFRRILTQAVEHPDRPLSEMEWITEEERTQILEVFNDTAADYRRDQTIHGMLEEQVMRIPDRVALVAEGDTLTYRDLNERADRLAWYLRDKGIGPNQVVGLLVERSVEMMVGMLGILKAGGAYMPISPDFPVERMSYMVENSGASLVLAQDRLFEQARSIAAHACAISDAEQAAPGGSGFKSMATSRDLAYVLYTSGSTGKPKGVMVEHHSVLNRLEWMAEAYGITEEDVLLQKTPHVFDVSVWELFLWFFAGARLVLLPPGAEKSPGAIRKAISHYGVTTLHFVPSMFTPFLDEVEQHGDRDDWHGLKRIFTSGEALMPAQVRRFHQTLGRKGQTRLYNLYGPTEATVDVSYFDCPPDTELSVVPIGKPIQNVRLYIVDRRDRLQPVGVPGELCIAGVCLARGYINRDDLTAEKFVPAPFAPGEIMYRTGDLARWNEDGNIQFLGRIDHQVKIRGHRIELDEVTGRLLQHPAVRDGAVIARQDGDVSHSLCAYLVAAGEWQVSELRRHMAESLPDYMIPAHFVEVEALPLNPNGKLDRRALPEPGVAKTEQAFVPPATAAEKLLVEVWQNVLGVERIGTLDNFFEWGGDSIKAIHILARLNRKGWQLEWNDLFKHPTIREVAPLMRRTDWIADEGPVEGKAPLTPIQQWFFHWYESNPHHWNQAVMLKHPAGWDEERVRAAFRQLAAHHDALRMIFQKEGERMVQVNRGSDAEVFTLDVIDCRKANSVRDQIRREADRIQRGLDINRGPLVRLALFRTEEGDHLLIVIHHLVVDGVSWRILLEDLETVYRQLSTGDAVNLSQKTSSYLAWSRGLEEVASTSSLAEERAVWDEITRTKAAPLPRERTGQTGAGALTVEVEEETTRLLLSDAHRAFQTEGNDLLLTAWAMAVGDWTGERRVALDLEGHGREGIVAGINHTRTVGWFTSLYPIVLEITPGDWSRSIKSVKETLRHIPNKGIGYGILRYLTADGARMGEEGRLRPQICFNYLGQFSEGEDNEGFVLSDMPVGEMVSPDSPTTHSLELSGMVRNGRLSLTLHYRASEYRRETMERLLESYRKQLESMVSHCMSRADVEHTPSDFSAQALTLEELDDVWEALKAKQ